jgi:predicted TIM-barrel fold metal-dependent hydrolase
MVKSLIEVAPDRCVWGSDWPHTDTRTPPDDSRLLGLLREWLSPAQLHDVLVGNPRRLYWA